jgi:hypothetical protein
MRFLFVCLILVAVIGCAQAYSLSGSSGNVKCTLFGAYEVPIRGADPNATAKEYALKVDVGLIGSANATYELVDGNNNVYHPDQTRSKALQPGRLQLVFVVPPTGDSIGGGFKLLKVSPSEGQPVAINWWKTPKKILGNIILRYYGITDLQKDADEQSMTFDVKITNNGTTGIPISPENFTILDQWGWDYYTMEGFSPASLEPKKSARVKVIFSNLSLLSKPSILSYDCLGGELAIDLEKDTGPLSDDVVYGANVPAVSASPVATKTAQVSQAQVQEAAQNNAASGINAGNDTGTKSTANEKVLSLKDQINATKQRLANAFPPGSTMGGKSAIGSQIGSSVAEAKARLAKAMENMHESANNNTQTVQS